MFSFGAILLKQYCLGILQNLLIKTTPNKYSNWNQYNRYYYYYYVLNSYLFIRHLFKLYRLSSPLDVAIQQQTFFTPFWSRNLLLGNPLFFPTFLFCRWLISWKEARLFFIKKFLWYLKEVRCSGEFLSTRRATAVGQRFVLFPCLCWIVWCSHMLCQPLASSSIFFHCTSCLSTTL